VPACVAANTAGIVAKVVSDPITGITIASIGESEVGPVCYACTVFASG
jgi:hypothetical protein